MEHELTMSSEMRGVPVWRHMLRRRLATSWPNLGRLWIIIWKPQRGQAYLYIVCNLLPSLHLHISEQPQIIPYKSRSSALLTMKTMKLLTFAACAAVVGAQSYAPQVASSLFAPMAGAFNASIESALKGIHVTSEIPQSFIEPIEVQIARKSYVYRQGAELRLNGAQWTASGANVYWLGLDENVIPPAGQPFYAPFNTSYPTFGRITEVMNTLQTMGARIIRSQTLGVSVGNPLSVMPALGVYNEQAFDTIDWAVFQARQHGLRIMAPLIDNYVRIRCALLPDKELIVAGLLSRWKVRYPKVQRYQHYEQRLFEGRLALFSGFHAQS